MERTGHRRFQFVWRASNLLLVISLLVTVYAGAWEFSVRSYLKGFSDAVVPASADPVQKVQFILEWMRTGPSRAVALEPDALAKRDPETTLNYEQLLNVCGTATNAFLNLARSAGLQVRRLLLLTPNRTTKHVVAEVFLDGRWIVVDPTYRTIMRDAQGRMLTKSDLKDSRLFSEAVGRIGGYPRDYDYANFAHVRISKLPIQSLHLRSVLDSIYPSWDESAYWSLLLERESFLVLFLAINATGFLAVWRIGLGWYAEARLGISRVQLRRKALRAGSTFFSTPEIK